MTEKQKRFVAEYLIDQNATQAYKRAGYKCKNDHVAQTNSHLLMLNPVISTRIAAGLAELARGTRMAAEEAWVSTSDLARSNVRHFFETSGTGLRLKPASEIPESVWATVKSLKVKRYTEGRGESAREVETIEWQMHDKLAALTLILRGHGQLKERKEHCGLDVGDVPIIIEFTGAAARPDA